MVTVFIIISANVKFNDDRKSHPILEEAIFPISFLHSNHPSLALSHSPLLSLFFDLLKHNLTENRLPFIIHIHYHENKLPTISFTFQIYAYLHIFIVLDFMLLKDVSFSFSFAATSATPPHPHNLIFCACVVVRFQSDIHNSISSIAFHFIHELFSGKKSGRGKIVRVCMRKRDTQNE